MAVFFVASIVDIGCCYLIFLLLLLFVIDIVSWCIGHLIGCYCYCLLFILDITVLMSVIDVDIVMWATGIPAYPQTHFSSVYGPFLSYLTSKWSYFEGESEFIGIHEWYLTTKILFLHDLHILEIVSLFVPFLFINSIWTQLRNWPVLRHVGRICNWHVLHSVAHCVCILKNIPFITAFISTVVNALSCDYRSTVQFQQL